MKKQELLHIHGLLHEVENYLEEETYSEEIDTEEYDSLGVGPTSLHKNKTDHTEAIFSLSGAITEYLEDDYGLDDSAAGKAAGD